jgi:hypothetical protein
MAAEPRDLTLTHAEWAAAVHAAFERERERQILLTAEDRLTAAERHWWATPSERAEAIARYRQLRARS